MTMPRPRICLYGGSAYMVRISILRICLYGERFLNGEVYLYDEHAAGAGIHGLISYLVCAWVFLDMFRIYTCPSDVFVIGGVNRI